MLNQTDQTLSEIFRVVLELPDGVDCMKIRRIGERRWDSLAHASLVAAIESEFRISLDTGEIERMTSYAATRLLLEEKGR